jgi:hypothetical protein
MRSGTRADKAPDHCANQEEKEPQHGQDHDQPRFPVLSKVVAAVSTPTPFRVGRRDEVLLDHEHQREQASNGCDHARRPETGNRRPEN